MGTDIHAAVEYQTQSGVWVALRHPNKYYGRWEGETPLTAQLDLDRDYPLFAILANVRNGQGFAGCLTNDPFEVITADRGLPQDISTEARAACNGDHSDTWVGLDELLAFDWTRVGTLYGYVNAPMFARWSQLRRTGAPTEYCGDISGRGISKISAEEMQRYVVAALGNGPVASAIERLPKDLYCQVSWQVGYAELAQQLWVRVLPTMLQWCFTEVRETWRVRLVMNFDS